MNVAVLGGGLTGLTAAWRLSGAGHAVRLLESGSRLGGPVLTDATGGWMIEGAPNSFRCDSPEIDRMLVELGLGAERIEPDAASKRSYISMGGKLVAVPSPSAPQEFLSTPLLTMGARIRLAAESAFKPRARTGDVSVADFVREHFGDVVLERIGQPLVSGIWAGDAERLSVRHAFPQAWEAERTTGSVIRALSERGRRRREAGLPPAQAMVSFRRGMQALPDALASRLPRGTAVLGAEVRSIGPGAGAQWRVRWTGPEGESSGEFDRVIAAIPGYSLAQLEIGAPGNRPLSGLSEIEYPPVASVFVGYRRDQVGHPLDGFGALVPAAEKRSILGVIFSSSLFPGRAPEGHVALTALAGGALNPGIAGLPRDELARRVCDDLEALLGARGKPAILRHTLWPRGIPQYNLGFERHLAAMAECERVHPGILIGGSVRDGIAIPECLASGASLAGRAMA
jgi:protoporphyrinogen/coproporphyrinogen III oxidase